MASSVQNWAKPKKIATVHFNNLEYYFIAHDKIKVKLLKLQGR